MQNEKIKFREVFKEGWKLTKANIGFLLGYSLLMFSLYELSDFILQIMSFSPFYTLGLLLLISLPDLGLYRSAIMMMKEIKPGFDQFYNNWKLLGPYLIAGILWFMMFFILSLLIVVPSIWVISSFALTQDAHDFHYHMILMCAAIFVMSLGMWMLVRFGFFPFFIVDKNSDPIDALKQAFKATRGNGWPLFWVYLVGMFLSSISVVTFEFANIIIWPLMRLVLGVAYNKLTKPEPEIIRTDTPS
jgi:hypothetical protein